MALTQVSLIAAGALLSIGLAGCGSPSSSAKETVNEIAEHGAGVCPTKLPQATSDTNGFGTSQPAGSTPSLETLDSAWVCVFAPVEVGQGVNGDGTVWGWIRQGATNRVPSDRLAAIRSDLGKLTPARPNQICTMELGSRYMLVYAHKNDLTGVVVDDYGCGDVRLTDEPFKTVPGDAGESESFSGVLSGPSRLLHTLKAVAG